jgi:hypothetical protein
MRWQKEIKMTSPAALYFSANAQSIAILDLFRIRIYRTENQEEISDRPLGDDPILGSIFDEKEQNLIVQQGDKLVGIAPIGAEASLDGAQVGFVQAPWTLLAVENEGKLIVGLGSGADEVRLCTVRLPN